MVDGLVAKSMLNPSNHCLGSFSRLGKVEIFSEPILDSKL